MNTSDSSSDDDGIYTNAAMKLKVMNQQARTKIDDDDDEEEDEDEVEDKINENNITNNHQIQQQFENKKVEVMDPTVSNKKKVMRENDVEDYIDISSTDEASDSEAPIQIDDSPYEMHLCRNTRKRNTSKSFTTPKSKRKNFVNSPRFETETNLNDSIEEELNALNNDSLNISQDNLDYVVIGSPIVKKSNNDDDYEVSIKVIWKSNDIKRFELRRNETFQKIFLHFASLEKVHEDQIIITRKDQRISPFDTPGSINAKITDIYDGGVVSVEMAKKPKGTAVEEKAEEEGCKIKIQTSDKKTLIVIVKNDEPFTALAKSCGEQLNIPVSCMKFYFDGELVDMSQTPESLDIEDEACFDLKITK